MVENRKTKHSLPDVDTLFCDLEHGEWGFHNFGESQDLYDDISFQGGSAQPIAIEMLSLEVRSE